MSKMLKIAIVLTKKVAQYCQKQIKSRDGALKKASPNFESHSLGQMGMWFLWSVLLWSADFAQWSQYTNARQAEYQLSDRL